MRKLTFFLGLAIAIFVSAQVAQATQVIDDTLQVNSLKVGQQGVGGVTYFNGTIINETTGDNDANNPVAFGDNVRIDGRVYRGATAGTSDDEPFIVNDNMEVTGSLTAGSLTTGSLGAGALTASTVNATSSITASTLNATGSASVAGDLTVDGDLTAGGSSILKKKIYTGTFDFTDDGDYQMVLGDYTYYWTTVSVPEIAVSDIPIVQVFTGTPMEAPEIYPDITDGFVNISFLVANFIVEDGKVHILYRITGDGDDLPIYNSEDYKIVVIY